MWAVWRPVHRLLRFCLVIYRGLALLWCCQEARQKTRRQRRCLADRMYKVHASASGSSCSSSFVYSDTMRRIKYIAAYMGLGPGEHTQRPPIYIRQALTHHVHGSRQVLTHVFNAHPDACDFHPTSYDSLYTTSADHWVPWQLVVRAGELGSRALVNSVEICSSSGAPQHPDGVELSVSSFPVGLPSTSLCRRMVRWGGAA